HWGQQGIKINDGIYSPISHLSRSQVQEIADLLGLKIEKIGENSRREGCILKHLLKMMTSEFHGKAVYESNVQLMNIVKSSLTNFSVANVKIIGPLSKNFALVNLQPLPSPELLTEIKNIIGAIPQIEKTEIVNKSIRLKIIANPGIYNDEKARYWIENGRLKSDFAFPICLEWEISKNNRLNTFQIVDYEFIP
ncbi:MAG: ExsB family protein, partial [Thermotogae bacterium]|nr:ExsB family protein [Thermotogota bacterium]